MNKYIKPELTIISFEAVDIIATSEIAAIELQTYGQNVKTVNSDDVVDLFE